MYRDYKPLCTGTINLYVYYNGFLKNNLLHVGMKPRPVSCTIRHVPWYCITITILKHGLIFYGFCEIKTGIYHNLEFQIP